MNNVLEQLHWRYAVKKFDPTKKIAPDVWKTLEEALLLSPSSFGLQPWKFFVVNDPEVRQKLKPASFHQAQITEASHLVVFTVKKNFGPHDVEHFIERMAEVRNAPLQALEGYKQIMLGYVKHASPEDLKLWTSKQVYIALGNFLTSAAMLGVDACPMEGISTPDYDKILGLDALGYQALCVATAGTRAADDAYAKLPKVRFKPDEVIAHIG